MAAKYTFIRVDTATRIKRDEYRRICPGWIWNEALPQFAIVDPSGKFADWPLLDSHQDAARDCRKFNEPDDGGAADEQLWLRRMAGDFE